jgi:tetratricopeptide (TPR) repeat protein
MKYILIICCLGISLVSKANDSTLIYWNKAKEMIVKEDYIFAEMYFLKAIKSDPKNFQIQNDLAALYANKLKRPNAALDVYSNVLATDPNNQEAIEEFVIMKLKHKKVGSILGVIDNLKQPKKINVDEVKGKCYFWNKQYDKALPFLEKAVNKNPKDFETYFYYATCLEQKEDIKKATLYYIKALEADGSKMISIYNTAINFYNEKHYQEVVQLLDVAITKGIQQDKEFKNLYASSLLATGDLVKGKKMIDEVIAADPANQELLYNTAQDFYYRQQYVIAKDYWTQLLKVNKEYYKALYMVGMCYKKLGDNEQGNKICDRAIEYDPSLRSLRSTQATPQQFGL